jgi:transposase-like protein
MSTTDRRRALESHGQRILTGADRQELREAEGKLASGSTVGEICRERDISETTLHRWKVRYGGMGSSEAKRLK